MHVYNVSIMYFANLAKLPKFLMKKSHGFAPFFKLVQSRFIFSHNSFGISLLLEYQVHQFIFIIYACAMLSKEAFVNYMTFVI